MDFEDIDGVDITIGIALDDDFEPGNHADNKAEIDEAVAKIRAGEWAAYVICILEDEKPTAYRMGNVVTDSGYDNVYSLVEKIPNEYLREQARGLLNAYLNQTRE